jgi:dihydropteroate synthase
MTFVRRPRSLWQLRTRSLALGERTLVMGVLNVTPDSFSERGAHFSLDAAAAHAFSMLDGGADLLDIGGESTRPGARAVSAREEQDRVLPVLAAILRERPGSVLSVDTYHAETARAAVADGAEIVNDVSGLEWDAAMAEACADLGCGVVLMHARGRPQEWRTQARLASSGVVPLVRAGLARSLERADEAGMERERVILDPGFGFGKVHDENYPLLAHLDELLALGRPLLAGVSGKSFLGHTLGQRLVRDAALDFAQVSPVAPAARGNATLAAVAAAILAGASVVRVHDVHAAGEAAAIADAILASA